MAKLFSILILLAAVTPVFAQAPSPTPETAPPAEVQPPATKLDEQQAAVRDRVVRLEDRLFQLNQALRKAEPEKAARLMETLGASRSLMIRQKMDEIIKKLQSKEYADAIDKEQIVTTDLQALLKGLLEEPDHSGQRKEEVNKLRALRQGLDKVIGEQKQERDHAAKTLNAENNAKQIAAAKERIDDLAGQQAALRQLTEKGGKGTDETKDIASKQQALSEQTQKTAESLTPPGQDDKSFTDSAEDLKKAAEQMKAARESLEKGRQEEAQSRQKAAEQSLQSAKDKLEKISKSKLLTLEEQAANQDQTASKTEQLSKDAESGDQSSDKKGDSQQKPGQQKSQDGEQKSGDSPKNQEQQQETPGKKNIQEAVPQQKQAAEELRKKDAQKALKKQDEALKKLQQAKEELEDRLEQLRKEQQEELLAALETRFRAMLAKQIECTKGTKRLNDLGREKWKRTDQLALADLSGSQNGIGDEAEKALFILKEEGTTVIFPQIIEQVRDDSRDVGEKLAAAVVGLPARTLQEGIEQALRELLDAIKKQQEENQSGQNGGGQSGDQGNSPLLPGSAELKLLRSCQFRVNKMTQAVQTLRQENAEAEHLKPDLLKLSQRQQQVSEMARQMHESMTKPQ